MAFTYSGTAGAAGATIAITGSETLATLKTSLASNTSWATVNGNSIVFNATLSIGSGTTTGTFTGSDFDFVFPQAYTFTIPNNSAQSGSSTTLSDAVIIFDGTAKSYTNAINYGTHTWTRVVYRSQIASPRTDLFSNTGCIFNFNNVQLAVSSTATSYPYDFIHQYNNTSVTVQGLTIAGLGGAGSANTVEIGSATGTTTTLQGLTLSGVIGVLTLNNGGASYSGTQDFRALSWPNNTSWQFNYGGGGGSAYMTNPNKPTGWTGYVFTGGAGGSGTVTERYTHDVTTVNAAASGLQNINVGDFTSGAIVTFGSITGGSSYTNGTYTNVPLTGGTGTGALANITVSGGAVTTVTLISGGYGYAVSNALSASAASIGGTGSGFSIPVATIAASSFLWTTTSSSTGAITEQYVTTAVITGGGGATTTYYSTTVNVVAWYYGYNTFVGSRTFSATGLGVTDTILMSADVTTLSRTAVAALTSLATLDNLYDASRYFNTLNSTNIQIPSLGSNIITANGTQLNLGSYNLVINSGTTTAGNAFQVSGSTITIYSSSLAVGTKFTSFTTTGTITVNSGVTVSAPFTTTNTVTNSGTINAQYTSSAGTSGVLTLTNMIAGSSIYVANGATQQTYLASSSTSNTFYYPPNSGATWTWKVAQYGYLPVTGSFTSNTISTQVASQSADPGYTNPLTTVQTWTSLANPDQIYDYAAYWETLNAGIPFTRATSKAGSNLSFGADQVTLSTSASNIYSISGTAVTVKSPSTFIAGTTYPTFSTTSTVTLTGVTAQLVYTTSSGTSAVIQFTGLTSGSSIYITNNSGVSQANTTTGTTFTFYNPPQATQTWNYKIALYTKLPVTGTFSTAGATTIAVNYTTDSGITQTNASTVGGYATLGSLDNVYDYMAWYETQTAGIVYTRPFTKSGAQIALGSVPFTSNATSTPVLAYTGTAPTVTAITFKGTTLVSGTTFGSILTTGTATFSNGAINHAVVYSSGGNSGIFTITGLTSTAVYLQNNSSTQQDYQSSITGTYTFYIPIGSTGTWEWVTKRSGYTYAFGTFNAATGGLYTAAPSLPQKLNPDGTVMYTGSSAALCTIVFTGTTEADITIGNGSVTVQVAFDSTETALATNAGMIWLTLKGECQQFLSAAGNFLFMSTGWRLKALNTSSPNAALYGYALSADGTPINAANGTVIILSTTLASQVAAAVWSTLTATQTTTGTFGNALQQINSGVQNASILVPYSGTI